MRLTALADGVDHSLYFELLARAFLVSEQIPASWPILAAEREALLRGDVPFFGARTDQTALLLENGERIEDYFVVSQLRRNAGEAAQSERAGPRVSGRSDPGRDRGIR